MKDEILNTDDYENWDDEDIKNAHRLHMQAKSQAIQEREKRLQEAKLAPLWEAYQKEIATAQGLHARLKIRDKYRGLGLEL